jgi:hypothetical protein
MVQCGYCVINIIHLLASAASYPVAHVLQSSPNYQVEEAAEEQQVCVQCMQQYVYSVESL